MLCGHALKLTVLAVSCYIRVADHSSNLPSKSLAGLDYFQIMETAQVQTHLRESLEPLYQVGVTHKSHQACHASSYNGNLCALDQCCVRTLLLFPSNILFAFASLTLMDRISFSFSTSTPSNQGPCASMPLALVIGMLALLLNLVP